MFKKLLLVSVIGLFSSQLWAVDPSEIAICLLVKKSSVCHYEFGDMYYSGNGVEKNDEKAFYWYEKAARQGHKEAQLKLGTMYAEGYGVEINDEKAFYWIEKAARQGVKKAQFRLGLMYELGMGVEQNLEKSSYWYGQWAANEDN